MLPKQTDCFMLRESAGSTFSVGRVVRVSIVTQEVMQQNWRKLWKTNVVKK